jgi:hypothetical protein
VETRVLTIGDEAFTVYGVAGMGWSPDPGDFEGPAPTGARYASLEEIFFALTNLSLSDSVEA